MIQDRPKVHKLVLSHNSLGDDGCETLFKFLCSDVGRSRQITEIKLAKNGLRNRGLLAIAEFMRNNHVLYELYIPAVSLPYCVQNHSHSLTNVSQNEFTPDPAVIRAFAAALNTSHLAKLNIGSHPALSDAFIEHFLPALSSNRLIELQLTMLGLTYTSTQYITAYVKDRSRCRHLRRLLLNANNLESEGITDIVAAIETGNWGLKEIEMFSNTSDQAAYAEQAKKLKKLLIRNQTFRRAVEKEALGLLLPARGLLMPPHVSETLTCHSSSSLPEPRRSAQLPTEICLHILSFLAPALSPSQRISVFSYASSYTTLPPLLPKLFPLDRGGGCVPDPTNSPLGLVGMDVSESAGKHGSGCMEGCMKGIVCVREVQRTRWLETVGCDIYEPTSNIYTVNIVGLD